MSAEELAKSSDELAVGDVVIVSGLKSRPDLNDSKGKLELWDADRERFSVRFANMEVLALKPSNLSKAPPPPAGPMAAGMPPPPPANMVAGGPPPPPANMVDGGAPPGGDSKVDESANWVTGTTPDGRKYWFNNETKESTWVEPEALAHKESTEEQPVELEASTVWKKMWDENYNRDYYYNTQTGESSWTPPSELVAGARPPPSPPPAGQMDAPPPSSAPAPPPPAQGANAAAGGGGGGGGGGAAVAQAAAAAMRTLIKEIQEIYDDAAAEELADRGGSEHGAAQAQYALDAAQKMLANWETKMRSL